MMLALAAALPAQTGDVDVMLQRAIRKESVEGDLKGAIELYKKIVAGAAKNRAAAAKALLRLGECYEKQGDAEAQRAYERLVREFGDQKEQARDAASRLASTGRSGAGSKAISAQLISKGSEREMSGRVTADGRLYPFIDPDTGDIAVRDLRTGTVKKLTNEGSLGRPHGARGYSPVPSRDGRQIAYEWEPASGPNELRLINIDGSGKRTMPLKGARISNLWDWSPDGKTIALDADGPDWWDVATIDLASGEVRRTGRSAGFGDFEAAGFSRDGRWLVYSREVRKPEPDWDIYAMDVKTGQETVVVTGAGRDRRPVWVPDSDTIVFLSDRNGKNAIWTVRFKDGQAAGEPVMVKADAGNYSPNGIGRDGSFYYTLRHESRDIYQAQVDSRTLRANDAPKRILETYLGHNWAPSWAPTGDSFAYYSEREANAFRLVIHHADGSEAVARELIRADQIQYNEYPVHWCGGGERLLAIGARAGGTVLLFDGRTAATLNDRLRVSRLMGPGDSFTHLAFSRDCQSFYLSTGRPQRAIVKLVEATGEKSELLADKGEKAAEPVLSPDGRWLAMAGKLEGGTETGILILSTAGGPLRMLDQGLRRSYRWSPDSKHLLYVRKASGTEKELYWASPEDLRPQPTGIRMPGLAHPSLNADGTKLLFGSATTIDEFWVLRNLALSVTESR
jgi:Tol biopolymer transport system component